MKTITASIELDVRNLLFFVETVVALNPTRADRGMLAHYQQAVDRVRDALAPGQEASAAVGLPLGTGVEWDVRAGHVQSGVVIGVPNCEGKQFVQMDPGSGDLDLWTDGLRVLHTRDLRVIK